VPWNGPFEPFARATAVVIRATWDYHQALDEYRAWLDRLDATRAFNAPDLVRWNLDKGYLTQLAARGAPIPASAVVGADAAMVAGALERMSLTEAVIKPTVGASGVGVERVSRGQETAAIARLRAVTRSPRARSPACSSAGHFPTASGVCRPPASFGSTASMADAWRLPRWMGTPSRS
jgi:hypothetical protein